VIIIFDFIIPAIMRVARIFFFLYAFHKKISIKILTKGTQNMRKLALILLLILFQLDIKSVASSFKPHSIHHTNTKKEKISANLQSKFKQDLLTSFSEKSLETELIGLARLKQAKNFTAKNHLVFTIIIDAGHGGKDSGAVGKKGIQEKNVVLSIAKKLAKEINQEPTLRAVLTRNGDYFVTLRERLKLARKHKGDLFVAIHADAAYTGDSATGASVYALSPHGATSEAARWLARRDNYSELGSVELDALKDRSPVLRSVLIDLAQTATIRDSIRLGNNVLDALDHISSLHYSHVEQAPFMVLKSPDIPSILVETGFISNLYEEKRLANPLYQAKMAHALKLGIDQYMRKVAVLGE
jgi:N-acetylmuramoyl-L-alanine amidase